MHQSSATCIDSMDAADLRMLQAVKLGYFPQAMLYNRGLHFEGKVRRAWRAFARGWAAKPIVGAKMREARKQAGHLRADV